MPDSKEESGGERERKRREDKVGGRSRKAVGVVITEEGSSAQRPDSNSHKEHFARCTALNHNLA